MASLTSSMRQELVTLASNDPSGALAIDVYRAIREEAELLYQTECIRHSLSEDPFRALQDIDTDSLGKRIRAVQYDCVRTRQDYVRIHAQVEVGSDIPANNHKNNSSSSSSNTMINFSFDREATEEGGTVLTYSIDLSLDPSQPSQKMLWVQVVAVGNHPSLKPAKDMSKDADEDDDWSDMESDDEAEEDDEAITATVLKGGAKDFEQDRKRAKTNNSSSENEEAAADDNKAATERDDDDGDCDQYVAGIDPDVLSVFIQHACQMDESTAFFLLMSFPFYEMEWDLVGFVLESVFGFQSDDDEKI